MFFYIALISVAITFGYILVQIIRSFATPRALKHAEEYRVTGYFLWWVFVVISSVYLLICALDKVDRPQIPTITLENK